jgi:hypothetical protein
MTDELIAPRRGEKLLEPDGTATLRLQRYLELLARTVDDAVADITIINNVIDTSAYELLANKATSFNNINNTLYPSVEAVENRIDQETLDNSYLTLGT